jgi:hypothetical protein
VIVDKGGNAKRHRDTYRRGPIVANKELPNESSQGRKSLHEGISASLVGSI